MIQKMKLKGKPKKIIKKSLLYIIFIYVIFSITFYYLLKNSNNINNQVFINFLLSGGNSHMSRKVKPNEGRSVTGS